MNYNVFMADEAIEDIFGLIKYIHRNLCNPKAAEQLYYNLEREIRNVGNFPLKFVDVGLKYRDYVIHRKVYKSYLIFYVVDEKRNVYVLRVLKDLMNWRRILRQTKIYHFSNRGKFDEVKKLDNRVQFQRVDKMAVTDSVTAILVS